MTKCCHLVSVSFYNSWCIVRPLVVQGGWEPRRQRLFLCFALVAQVKIVPQCIY